jgi:hypothetical protein
MEHPVFSVREELVPQALVNVKVFEGKTSVEVEEAINVWISETQNLVVCPGPLSTGEGGARMAVTYVKANINNDPERRRKMEESPKLDAVSDSDRFRGESDGGRIA